MHSHELLLSSTAGLSIMSMQYILNLNGLCKSSSAAPYQPANGIYANTNTEKILQRMDMFQIHFFIVKVKLIKIKKIPKYKKRKNLLVFALKYIVISKIMRQVRPRSVDLQNGGFLANHFGRVGRSVNKKLKKILANNFFSYIGNVQSVGRAKKKKKKRQMPTFYFFLFNISV